MPSLRVYDTKGNEHSPSGGTGRTNETVKDLFYDGVRLTIETGRDRKFTTFFRARETRNARAEQFYAVYTGRDATVREFIDTLRDRIELEWGYTMDDSADDMAVFRALDAGRRSVPGDDRERSIVEELIGSRQTTTVGVRDAEHALGLVSELMSTYDRAAIADSPESSALSGFDLVVAPDGTRGIAPLGDTESRWESTKESLRSRHIDKEVDSIRESVQTLSREYDLSSSEIRSRVYRRVPALRSPNTGSSKAKALASAGSDDGILTPAVGKALFVGALALIVLLAGAWGAMAIGLVGGDDTVQGTVYVDTEGNETADGLEITLESAAEENSSNDALNATTEADGTFTVEDVPDGEYDLSVHGSDRAEYDDRVVEPGTDIGIDPDRVRISGDVVDAETNETISTDGDGEVDATVELVERSDENGESIDASEGGSYEFTIDAENVSENTAYAVTADAEGYESASLDVETFGVQDAIELEQVTMSLSGEVTDSRTDEGAIEDATVTVTTDAGQEFTARTDADGEYETDAEVPIGSHNVEADADGFVTETETVSFEEDENAEQDFELDAEASMTGGGADDSGNSQRFSYELEKDGETIEESSTSGDAEEYEIDGLEPGDGYSLTAERSGVSQTEDDVSLEPGEELEVNFVYQSGPDTVEITVEN